MAPVIPIAASLITGYLGNRAAKKAAQAGRGEQRTSADLTQLIGQLRGQGGQLFGRGNQLLDMAQPYLQKSGGYFSDILGGDPARLSQAIQPEVGAITSSFRGGERNIRSQARGGTRDLALATLSRDRSAAIGNLVPQVRAGAASSLGELGARTAGLGIGAQTGATSALGSAAGSANQLLGTQQYGRLAGEDMKRQSGADIGGFITDLLINSRKGDGSSFNTGIGTYYGTPA